MSLWPWGVWFGKALESMHLIWGPGNQTWWLVLVMHLGKKSYAYAISLCVLFFASRNYKISAETLRRNVQLDQWEMTVSPPYLCTLVLLLQLLNYHGLSIPFLSPFFQCFTGKQQ